VEDSQGDFRPPYLPFQTFWSFIGDLLANPLPPRIDRSLMTSKSGTDQVHLTAALKAFGLVDANQAVTGLRDLEGADEAARAGWLAEQIRKHYPAQIKVSEENGTEQQLKESFRVGSGTTDSADTLRKSIRFFLHAAREAGIPLSPHFPATRGGSGAPGAPKPKRSASKRKPGASQPRENGTSTPASKDGDKYSVDLASGGSVSVVVSVNLFSLSKEDRKFVIDLVDALKDYDGGSPSTDKAASGTEDAPAEARGDAMT
jgi:hypothetical protein